MFEALTTIMFDINLFQAGTAITFTLIALGFAFVINMKNYTLIKVMLTFISIQTIFLIMTASFGMIEQTVIGTIAIAVTILAALFMSPIGSKTFSAGMELLNKGDK